jgi:hypothetical protein
MAVLEVLVHIHDNSLSGSEKEPWERIAEFLPAIITRSVREILKSRQ